MNNKKNQHQETAYYADTDAYGIVWHGTYLRWLERARTVYCENLGIPLPKLEIEDLVFPIVEVKIRYYFPVKLHQTVSIFTHLKLYSPLKLAFDQEITTDRKTHVKAQVIVAAVHKDRSIYRRLPRAVQNVLDKAD